jgi:hypothetical protein
MFASCLREGLDAANNKQLWWILSLHGTLQGKMNAIIVPSAQLMLDVDREHL